ncbi:hypothetical protein NVP1181O_64 [Vibrio phage 1.181.O._10N.286.46.C9]|nr:hypothetical protein NVP1181O_64 [Vibrio phage 1.181.O._10N.286.46.C9]
MYKTTERCDTQEKLVSAIETIDTVRILNKDEFLGTQEVEFPNLPEFCRTLNIEVNGVAYKMTWFKNYSSIESEFMQSSFDSIVLNKPTWPLEVGSKLKLQLMSNSQLAVLI